LTAVGLAVVIAAGVGTAWQLGAFQSAPAGVPTTVYLKQDATPAQKAAIEAYVRSLRLDGDVHFETRQEAFENFQKLFTNAPNITGNVPQDALPEAYRFVLADPKDVPGVKAHLAGLSGVDQVIAGNARLP
jgi:cell division protein FtsX